VKSPANTGSAAGPAGAHRLFALVFGLFLGLAILKFGNPVILDHQIQPPRDASEWLTQAWPVRWASPLLMIVAVIGVMLSKPSERLRQAGVPWLPLVLALAWLGWQFLSARHSVDPVLTAMTLPQLTACVACFAVGFLVLGRYLRSPWLWGGLLVGFLLCLNKAAQQHFFEMRQDYNLLVEGQAAGWTNFSPAFFAELKAVNMIITTNGVDVANPVILEKMRKARVNGTVVYPNALAGLILLLLPGAVVFLLSVTSQLKQSVRWLVLGLILFLGLGGLYWTGSKAGWLVAIAVGAAWMLVWPLAPRLKVAVVALLLVGGLGMFGLRFAGYFAKGATSAAARFDYWKAAVQNTRDNPVFGSGPGTFQRPYARLKAPESEMARLVHNDYLEQATDSGLPGFLFYVGWIGTLLFVLGRQVVQTAARLKSADANIRWEAVMSQALFFGLLGWFAHGFAEFGLYIPAPAWIAFALAGGLLSQNPASVEETAFKSGTTSA
jgi:O-antigen ligase